MEKILPLETRPRAINTGVGIAPTGRILAARRKRPTVTREFRAPAAAKHLLSGQATTAPRTSWKTLLGVAVFLSAAVYASSTPPAPTRAVTSEQQLPSSSKRASLMSSAKEIAANYYQASYVRDVYSSDFVALASLPETEEAPRILRVSHAPQAPVTSASLEKASAGRTGGGMSRAPAGRGHSAAMVRRVQEIIKYYAPKGIDSKPLAERIVWESAKQGYDPLFVAAVIKAESRFNSQAKSDVGARGLMQIMPATGRWLAGKHNIPSLQLYDRDQNLRLGIAYLKELEEEYGGDKVMTLVAYNWGPGHVQSAGRGKRRIPGDVMRYAVRILNDYRRWRGDAIAPARAFG